MKLIKTLALVASVFAVVSCSDDKAQSPASKGKQVNVAPTSSCVIQYGWESRQPYQFFENKEMKGIDVQIMQTAASKAGCELSFVEKPWGELLEMVESGKVDILAGATQTAERAEYANFSEPYRKESFSLFVSNDSGFDSSKIQEFLSLGNRIGVSNGYFYGEEVDALMEHPQYKSLFRSAKKNEQNFYNVQYGQVDGVLADPVEGNYILKRKGLTSQIKESSINIPADSVSFMFSKKSKNADKLKAIADAVSEMVKNKEPEKVIASYQ